MEGYSMTAIGEYGPKLMAIVCDEVGNGKIVTAPLPPTQGVEAESAINGAGAKTISENGIHQEVLALPIKGLVKIIVRHISKAKDPSKN